MQILIAALKASTRVLRLRAVERCATVSARSPGYSMVLGVLSTLGHGDALRILKEHGGFAGPGLPAVEVSVRREQREREVLLVA